MRFATLLSLLLPLAAASINTCQINLCFAVDGSGSINNQLYMQQLRFIRATATLLQNSTVTPRFAAVQYGVSNLAISPLTEDGDEFRKLVRESSRAVASETNLIAGISYCFGELLPQLRDGELSVIVVLGDGVATIGGDAVERADLFRENGGRVVSVGVGATVNEAVLRGVGGGGLTTLSEFERVFPAARAFLTPLC